MSQETPNKKRKNEEEIKVEDTKDTKKRLITVFNQIDAVEILTHLRQLVENDSLLKELGTIFTEKEFPILNLTEHCVRCHHNFDPDHNKNFKCNVEHSKPPGEETINGKLYLTFDCCQQKFEIDPNDPNLDLQIAPCQKTNHTTNKDYIESFIPCQTCGTGLDEGLLEDEEDSGFIVEEEIGGESDEEDVE